VWCARKSHNTATIYAEIEGHFGSSASLCPWVTELFQDLGRGYGIFEPSERSDNPEDPLRHLKIINFSNLNPLASVPQIALVTKNLCSIVFDHSKGLGLHRVTFEAFLYHHTLAMIGSESSDPKAMIRVKSAKRRGWTHSLTTVVALVNHRSRTTVASSQWCEAYKTETTVDPPKAIIIIQGVKKVRPPAISHAPLFMLIHICHAINDDYINETMNMNFLKYN
jgi:hypothetical protein